MKANKIINSISSILNESNFAKYTLRQVYDELVYKEDLADYLKKLAVRAVKLTNLDYLTNMKAQDYIYASDTMIAFGLAQRKNKYEEKLTIQLHMEDIEKEYIEVDCRVFKSPLKHETSDWCRTGNNIFSLKEVDVINALKVAIKDACESPEVKKLRQECLRQVKP